MRSDEEDLPWMNHREWSGTCCPPASAPSLTGYIYIQIAWMSCVKPPRLYFAYIFVLLLAAYNRPRSFMSSTSSLGSSPEARRIWVPSSEETRVCVTPLQPEGECLVSDSGSWKRSESVYNQSQLRSGVRVCEWVYEVEEGVSVLHFSRERERKVFLPFTPFFF